VPVLTLSERVLILLLGRKTNELRENPPVPLMRNTPRGTKIDRVSYRNPEL
jgi:hypothetical protein